MSHLQTRGYEARSMLSFLSRPNWSMMVFTRRLGAQLRTTPKIEQSPTLCARLKRDSLRGRTTRGAFLPWRNCYEMLLE